MRPGQSRQSGGIGCRSKPADSMFSARPSGVWLNPGWFRAGSTTGSGFAPGSCKDAGESLGRVRADARAGGRLVWGRATRGMSTLIGRMPSKGLQASQIFIIGLAVASRGWATYRLPYCAAPATPPTRQGAAPCSIAIRWTQMYSGQIPMETESAAESAAERYKKYAKIPYRFN